MLLDGARYRDDVAVNSAVQQMMTFSTRLFMYMNSRVLLCRWIFTTSKEEAVLAQKWLSSGKKCV